MKLLHTIKESCAALGIGRSRFYELIKEGDIEVCKLGNRTLVATEDLQRFANSLVSRRRDPGIEHE